MNLTDILHPSCVLTDMHAPDKTAAITQLVDVLAANDQLVDREAVLKAVMEREATRSTGIGDGLAVPHGKSNGCRKLAMSIGRPREPIDFESADGKPVELVVLLASPPDQTGPHIQALAKVSRLMLSESFRTRFRAAGTSEQAYQIIAEFDSSA